MPNNFTEYHNAESRGYTRRVWIFAGDWEFLALVKPAADLSGIFRAYDVAMCEFLSVTGWNVEVDTGESCHV